MKKNLSSKRVQKGKGYTYDLGSVNAIPIINYMPDKLNCSSCLPHSGSLMSDIQSFNKYIGGGGRKKRKRSIKRKSKSKRKSRISRSKKR